MELGSYYYIFRLQCLSGCRISEALNVSCDDIGVNGSVMLRGLKGSNDRYFFDAELAKYFISVKSREGLVWRYCNRFSAYRLLRGLGVGTQKVGRERMSITHVFRNEHIKQIRSMTSNKEVIASGVGHKSIKSQEHYG